MVKKIVEDLFEKRGSTDEFRHHLSLVTKTGNTEDIIKVIRTRLSIVGLGYNLVPCIRLVKKSSSEIQTYSTSMCEPERTFAGFRCNLIKCVDTVSYFLFGTKELNGQRVDIWGDGCEIGGVETPRIALWILTDKIKCQSSDAVFCFAAYRVKDSIFAMEQNLGPTIAGVQESGWLFMKTLELSKRELFWHTVAIRRFYWDWCSVSQMNQLAIECYIENATLYVTELDYPPTKCHRETGLRSDVIIPFRKDLPKSSLVFYENIQSVCPDARHMTTRYVEKDL